MAQLERGQLRISETQVDPKGLVAEAAEMQQSRAESCELDVILDVKSNVPDVCGDRDRLLQVFENLIGNAIKFTGTGGRITIGARANEQEVLFSVADTGRGIPPENLARVFDPFWQAAGHAGHLGAGLGLPITKGIVEAHGGRIWVESTPGQGSTFFFTVPKFPGPIERPAPTMH